jgi:isopentenyl-diphosphate delta-isomerase
MSGSDIGSRKSEHLDLCIEDDVAFQDKTNLFEEVQLVHDALPELALDEIDLRTELVGKTLKAPLVIAAMTGGVERANAINRDLASVAEELGIGFALGSQRPLLSHGIEDGYRVRDVAPTALLLGNIGLVQARDTSTAALGRLVEQVGADALCLHLNPAMEVVQPGGDRDFRGGLDTIARVARELPVPVIVKETGCGLSRRVGERIKECGVQWVDTSGAGGTSWVGVETKRAKATKALGERFWDWGIPTAASVLQLRGLGLGIVATGGMTDGLMIARALALGARAGGIARPFLQAHAQGGIGAARTLATNVIEEIRLACLLTGSRTPADLATKPTVLGPRLQRWMPADH